MTETSPKDAFDAHSVPYRFVRGYRDDDPDEKLMDEAMEAAFGQREVLLFLGSSQASECEDMDREDLSLPESQLRLVSKLLDAGLNVSVVLFGGSPVELPFADRLCAILYMCLPGKNGGTAVYDLLYGLCTPSGKLSETWPLSLSHVPAGDRFSKDRHELYKESIFVGYRYYVSKGVPVRFPFGYGLSYSTFDYSRMELTREDGKVTVSCQISNTGAFDGAEIVQLYVKGPEGVFKPLRELRGFAKIYLKAGESGEVRISVREEDLKYYHPACGFVMEKGTYEFQLCADACTVKLSKTVELEGDEVPAPYPEKINRAYLEKDIRDIPDEWFYEMAGIRKPEKDKLLPIRVESRFSDLSLTFWGRLIRGAVLSFAGKNMKKAMRMKKGPDRTNRISSIRFLIRILDSSSLIGLSMSSGARLSFNVAEGIAVLANGHILKALRVMTRRTRVPPLPKDAETRPSEKKKR